LRRSDAAQGAGTISDEQQVAALREEIRRAEPRLAGSRGLAYVVMPSLVAFTLWLTTPASRSERAADRLVPVRLVVERDPRVEWQNPPIVRAVQSIQGALRFQVATLTYFRRMERSPDLRVVCIERPSFRDPSLERRAEASVDADRRARRTLGSRVWRSRLRKGGTLITLASANGEWFSKGGKQEFERWLAPTGR
jgi:hypothetical protein